MKVSVVLPTYNERQNIKILLPMIEKDFFKANKINGEIIVVDDNSPDGTAEAARKINKKYGNIRVIVRQKKEGIGAALRAGYDSARYELILSSDVDLSFKVKDMTRLLNSINSGYDLVVGSRYSIGGSFEKTTTKTRIEGFLSKFGNRLTKVVSGVRLNDFSANFRAVKNEVWKSIKTRENTNSILLEMILKAYYKGYKVTEIPVVFSSRKYGESKLNLKKEAPKFFGKLIYHTWKCRIQKDFD